VGRTRVASLISRAFVYRRKGARDASATAPTPSSATPAEDFDSDRSARAASHKMNGHTGFLVTARRMAPGVSAPVKKRRARWDGVPSLSHELAEKREAALSRAQDAVKSARFHALTLDIAAWLETGEWTSPHDDRIRDAGQVPIEVSAARQLDRRWKKIRSKGKAIVRLDARRRHKLRIQTKKVRYAVEFFGSLFPGKRTSKRRKRFQPALEALQDALGDLNDIAVHEELIGAAGMRRRRVSRKRAFATGVLMGHEDARLDAALAAAIGAYAELAKVKRFWA